MIGFIVGLEVSISVLLPNQLKFGVQNLASNLLVPRAPCRVNPALYTGYLLLKLYMISQSGKSLRTPAFPFVLSKSAPVYKQKGLYTDTCADARNKKHLTSCEKAD